LKKSFFFHRTPYIEWFPHLLPTYERFLTSFICCGWAYEVIIRWFQLHVWAKIWEVFWNYGSLLGCKWHHCTVAEVLTQHGMVPTSPPNICKVVDKLHMLWMGIWIHYQANFITCIGQELGSLLKLWFNAGLQMTPLCRGRGSNPTWNGSNISSQHLRGAWQASYTVDGHMAPSWGHVNYVYAKIWEVIWNSGSLLGYKWHHCAVAEVLIQHGMVPTSSSNIWKMLDNLHMLWMGIWSHH